MLTFPQESEGTSVKVGPIQASDQFVSGPNSGMGPFLGAVRKPELNRQSKFLPANSRGAGQRPDQFRPPSQHAAETGRPKPSMVA
jgi:hypothetical protein